MNADLRRIRRRGGLAARLLVLIAIGALVWWALWFMMMGALMSLEELNATIGPVLGEN